MADEKIKKATEGLLNSVLISTKGGVPLHQLAREYREVTMSDIPLEKLGFSTIESYIRSIPHCAFLQTSENGMLIVKGVTNESNHHIAKLVSGQKKGKKKSSSVVKAVSRGRGKYARGNVYRIASNLRGSGSNYRPSFHQTTAKRPFSGATYISKSASSPSFATKPNTQLSGRAWESGRTLQNGSSNFWSQPSSNVPMPRPQINFNLPPRMKKLQNTANIFNRSDNRAEMRHNDAQPQHTSNEKDMKFDARSMINKGHQIKDVRQNVLKILDRFPNGIWSGFFCNQYKEETGSTPDDLMNFLKVEMKEVVEVKSMVGDNEIICLRKPKLQQEKVKEEKGNVEVTVQGDTRVITVAKATQGHQTNEAIPQEKELNITQQEVPKIGETISLYVCHVDTIDRFFAQRSDSEITDLSEKIQSHYESKSKRSKWTPKVGGVCCATYLGQWYRARVISTKTTGQTASAATKLTSQSAGQNEASNCVYTVFYLDFGNLETVGDDEIRKLETEFCHLPAQAIQCRLRGVAWTGAEQEWSSESIALFRELTEDVLLRAKVADMRDNIIVIDLRTPEGKSVADALAEKGLAISEHKQRTASLPLLPIVSTGVSPEKEESQPDEILSPKPSLLYRLNSLTLDEQEDAEVKQVELPKDDTFDVLVTAVNSLNEISAVLVDDHYQGRLKVLEAGMQIYFDSDPSDEKLKIEIGCVYAAFFEEAWYRVRVTELWEDNAEIHFVDRGDIGKAQISCIKKLPAQFKVLPLQAIELTLAELPDSDNQKHIQVLCDAILGKECVAIVYDREEDVTVVELLEGSSEDGISVNVKIATELNLNDEEIFKQTLPPIGDVMDGFVSNISESGVFNVSLNGPGIQQLDTLNEELQKYYAKGLKAADFVKSPETDQIVCVKHKEDGVWCRASITCIMALEKKAEVEFIDYGTRSVISIRALRKIPEMLEELRTHPPQTVRCQLADCPEEAHGLWKDGLAARLLAAWKTKTVVIKPVKEADDHSLASVQLLLSDPIDAAKFTSIAEDVREICSSLRNVHPPPGDRDDKQTQPSVETSPPAPVEAGFVSAQHQDNGKSENPPISSQMSHSSSASDTHQDRRGFTIRNAVVPCLEIEESFVAVYVSNVQSPSNFHFLLHKNLSIFADMMEELQKHYKHSEDAFDDYCEGDVCAVLTEEDETWYRGIIRSIDEIEDLLSVLLADEGKTRLVPSCDVRPLHQSFLSLPFQAVKGSLADVPRPSGGKWRRTVCKALEDMTFEHVFYAKIHTPGLKYPAMYSLADHTTLDVTLHCTGEADQYVVNTLIRDLKE